MAILWRQLLDATGVRWIDRGHNTARGHVNIRCPWCGPSDPSYHLGIKETTGDYFCLRNPDHAGHSPFWLLTGLGVPSFQQDALLRDFADDSPPARTQRTTRPPTDWDKFASAADDTAALHYLKSRGLDPPAVLARRYDMRFSRWGPDAWRILLPLRLNGDTIGWTGRAIRDHQIPRYRANDPTEGTSLYIPVYPNDATRTVVIVEGPFDAIAVADAYHPTHETIAIAVVGLNISPLRRQHIADVIGLIDQPRVIVVLDADQERNKQENFKNILARATGIPHPWSFPLPAGAKDAGEMSRDQIRHWLNQLPDHQRGGDRWRDFDPNGAASLKTGRGRT